MNGADEQLFTTRTEARDASGDINVCCLTSQIRT